MRHSIKLKISLMILTCSLVMVAILVLCNTTLLDKFYMADKANSFQTTYSAVDDYMASYEAGTISEEEFKEGIDRITLRSNISLMIIDSDWTIIYASMHNVDEFMRRLQNSLFDRILQGQSDFSHIEGLDVVIENKDYTLYNMYNSKMNDTFMELIGNMTTGEMIYMSLGVKSIQDNVDISNRFIAYVGLLIAGISALGAFLLGNVIAKPIKELSVIAERMSELDFDAVYVSNDKGEIGLLGNSMNKLSSKLENTISELKSANAELQHDIEAKVQIDELRKEFLSNVSHELKTPIALIQGYAEGLKESVNDDPESMDFYCDVIMDEAGKMNNMVKKLLSLNQLEFGNEQLDMERFDLVEVMRAVINANKLLADQKGIQVEFAIDTPIYVWADEYKIEEVVTNYLTNAINHCKYDNKIKITVDVKDGIARVSVFNTGDQIPKEDIDNIWIKFYKVDKARTREYGGNGIGLSIVKAIMDNHNRKCGVINHEDGVEFWFELDAGN